MDAVDATKQAAFSHGCRQARAFQVDKEKTSPVIYLISASTTMSVEKNFRWALISCYFIVW